MKRKREIKRDGVRKGKERKSEGDNSYPSFTKFMK
jgi:hypothetical protein